jgi:hypothetical protein
MVHIRGHQPVNLIICCSSRVGIHWQPAHLGYSFFTTSNRPQAATPLVILLVPLSIVMPVQGTGEAVSQAAPLAASTQGSLGQSGLVAGLAGLMPSVITGPSQAGSAAGAPPLLQSQGQAPHPSAGRSMQGTCLGVMDVLRACAGDGLQVSWSGI